MVHIKTPESFLRGLFERAVEVADPMRSLAEYLPEKPSGRVVVLGAGKASARMAEAVEAHWGPCEGLVITRYGYARPCKQIEIVEAAHPVPDESGFDATKRVLELAESLTADDYVLCLISGGASALLTAPIDGLGLADKQRINSELLASGAPIHQMNLVRKHLSQVKGGQLAKAVYPAKMLNLMISDVPGDDPAFIGSGPTVGDCSKPEEALLVLDKYKIEIPRDVRSKLLKGSGVVDPDDSSLTHTKNIVYAAPSQSIQSAAELAVQAGCEVLVLGDAIEGEAREVACEQAAIAVQKFTELNADSKPLLILSGGELTVTRNGSGVGGPNAEFCLALAIELSKYPQASINMHALAGDTDGVDGAAEIAGAIIGPDTLKQASEQGVDPIERLQNNDAHSFFEKLGAQLITGPTLTNVNDFRAILVQSGISS